MTDWKNTKQFLRTIPAPLHPGAMVALVSRSTYPPGYHARTIGGWIDDEVFQDAFGTWTGSTCEEKQNG